MKQTGWIKCLIFIGISSWSSEMLYAQQPEIHPRQVVVNWRKKSKGVLEKVTSNKIFISTKDHHYLAIDVKDLKSIKIKKFPRRKRAIRLLQPQPGLTAYDQNGFLKKEYLDTDYSLGEKAVISGTTILLKGLYGFLYNKLHNEAVYRIHRDSLRFSEIRNEISNFAAHNQVMNYYNDKKLQTK